MGQTLLLLFALGVAGTCAAASPEACPIPLAKDTEWQYEGNLAWTPISGTSVITNQIRWTSRVVESFTTDRCTAAVIHGMPNELAWAEPSWTPHYSVLLYTSNRVYQFSAKTENHAKRFARKLVRSPSKLTGTAAELLSLPLTLHARWSGDLGREDGWYCWHVERCEQSSLSIRGFNSDERKSVYTIGYRTCPEHEIMEVVPDVGIIRYLYDHHGTVASTDVRLVSFRQGM